MITHAKKINKRQYISSNNLMLFTNNVLATSHVDKKLILLICRERESIT